MTGTMDQRTETIAADGAGEVPGRRIWGAPAAAWGIIVSSTILAFSSGLIFTYVPVKLHALGFEPWVSAAMMPAVAAGGLFGCFAFAPLLRHAGHARVFMLIYAMVAAAHLAMALTTDPYAWLAMRFAYGFAVNGMFIVAQSWLHHSVSSSHRGRVISIFYAGYVMGLGIGAFVLGQVDTSGDIVPVIGALAVLAAMTPVGLTRLEQPPPPGPVGVSIRRVWSISPVGLVGMLAAGGLSMTFIGMTPIWLLESGRDKADIGVIMLVMQVGLMFVQTPLGMASDHMDRRVVLLAACAGSVVLAACGMLFASLLPLLALALMLAIWNGCNESLYSISSALATDRAEPADYVLLSSTQLVAWSASAFIVPTIITLVVQVYPVGVYMIVCGAISIAFGVFVAARIAMRPAAPQADREPFRPITAQAAHAGDYVAGEDSRTES